MSFPARYPGVCAAGCGEPIEPGQDISIVSDFRDSPPEYRHAGCPDDTPPPKPTRFEGTSLDEMGY